MFDFLKKQGFDANAAQEFWAWFILGSKALMRDGQALGGLMPQELSGRWTFLLEKQGPHGALG